MISVRRVVIVGDIPCHPSGRRRDGGRNTTPGSGRRQSVINASGYPHWGEPVWPGGEALGW